MKKILGHAKRLSMALLLILVALVAFPVPAYAIADPDTAPQVSAVYVYEFSAGAVGVLIDYYLDYAPLPSETVTEAYLAVFVDTDGTTQLKSVAPYTFVDSGYGRGLAWIAFTAAEATAYGLTSASIANYRIWLVGNPGLAWETTGDPPKKITTIDQWVTTDVPETLATRILYYADVLELVWSLDMVGPTADGNKLTSTGESYFENVISGCRTLAPGAFSDTTSDPDYMSISYDTAFGATATSGTANVTGSPVTLTPKIPVVNYSFENGDPPIAWALVGAGATFNRSAVQSEEGTYSGLLTRVGADSYISQSINPADYVGDDVIFGAWVYATVVNGARIALDDDVGAIAYSAYHSGVAGWEWLTVPYTVGVAATELQLRCYIDNTAAYFDNVALVGDINVIDTGVTTGTIIIDLAQWTSGTIINGTGTMTGSPVTLYPGVNTLTVTANGTFTTSLEVVDTAVIYERSVEGTGFDLTALATAFGMSRWMLSGLVWMFISVVACAFLYVSYSKNSVGDSGGGATKATTLLFVIMLVGGMLLGMVHPLVVSLLLIAAGAFIGYILFFRSEALHKGFMFMIWMFVIVSIAGNIAASGQVGTTTTRLTNAITATETDSIPVASTVGFASAGIILIGDEQITYPSKDDTHFLDTTFNDIVRGSASTDNVSHAVNSSVRTKESYLLNTSIDYKIARITDSAGVLAFITLPFRLFDLVVTFFKLPLEFLGTDLAILTYIWMVVAVGMIVGFVVSLAGGRRV